MLGRIRSATLLLAALLCASRPFEAKAQSVARDAEAPLTNASVVKLVRAGFSEKTVIAIVRTRPARFDLSPERLVELKKAGVGEKVILAMLARDGEQASFAIDDLDDEDFFGRRVTKENGHDGAGASRGSELGIFGSSGGSRSRSRSATGGAGGAGETETAGSAAVRILRPPAEPGGAAPKLERTPTLTNDSVAELFEAGFSEGTIIRRIEQSPVDFDLSPAKLAELRRRRVTESIIAAMRAAMGDEGTQEKN